MPGSLLSVSCPTAPVSFHFAFLSPRGEFFQTLSESARTRVNRNTQKETPTVEKKFPSALLRIMTSLSLTKNAEKFNFPKRRLPTAHYKCMFLALGEIVLQAQLTLINLSDCYRRKTRSTERYLSSSLMIAEAEPRNSTHGRPGSAELQASKLSSRIRKS